MTAKEAKAAALNIQMDEWDDIHDVIQSACDEGELSCTFPHSLGASTSPRVKLTLVEFTRLGYDIENCPGGPMDKPYFEISWENPK